MVDYSSSEPESSVDDHDLNRCNGRKVSTLSTTSKSTSDSDPFPSPGSTISQFYADADAFAKLLKDIDALRQNDTEDEEAYSGFSRLVGKYLDSKERAALGRSVSIDVAGTTWTDKEVLTSEPESRVSDTGIDDVQPQSAQTSTSTTPGEEESEPFSVLDSREILTLLIQEFGPLTQLGEEHLILEADGCMWLGGVVVVGVIHLTTHRLSFHASLLSSRPEMPESQRIIKSGSTLLSRCIITEKGLYQRQRQSKRLWMELSHDMLALYSSSRDEDRIRPRRTILLSKIQKVLPQTPTSIIVQMQGGAGVAEFDTPEATSEWRRELDAAIFLDRHRRRESLADPDREENSGIRFSCPLDKILKVVPADSLLHFVAIHIQPVAETEVGDLESNLDSPGIEVRINPMVPSPEWQRLEEFVQAAKSRLQADDEPSERLIIVDLGPLGYSPPTVALSGVVGVEGRVRTALALSDDTEAWIVRARLILNHPLCYYGFFVVSPGFVGFWCHTFGSRQDVNYRLPASIVKSARATGGKRFSFFWSYTMLVQLEGHEDMKFRFKSQELRDEAVRRVNAVVGKPLSSSNFSVTPSTPSSEGDTPPSTPPVSMIMTPPSPVTRSQSIIRVLSPPSRAHAAVASVGLPPEIAIKLPKAINIKRKFLSFPKPLHYVCLTIGSRGDVQPYIALGLGLMKQGHRVTIVTHEEYKGWVESFGVGHRTAGGDPGALMKLSVEQKMFSPEFFRESIGKFRPWLDHLLADSWESCRDADVLLESPSAMAGVHIAEALRIPYFRTFTMPWSKTSEFPHPMLSPPVDSQIFNSMSHVLFSNVMWTATSGQINRWRVNTLKIGPADANHLSQSKIVHIYNFSEAVVPKPLDWGDTTTISGYWFLDNPDKTWYPPPDLTAFLDRARKDRKPVVYIGFGSITVPHPNRLTRRIIKAVLQSGVRAIIAKGWSSRMVGRDKEKDVDDPSPEMPEECYAVDSIPHDWLFPKVDAVLHHGGAGTTGASLRAGIPTLIKPWFGDQYFWAARVQKLGAGLRVPSLRVNDLADALTKATTNRLMKEKAASIGERIRAEDGVGNAIYVMYTHLSRASQDRTPLGKDVR